MSRDVARLLRPHLFAGFNRSSLRRFSSTTHATAKQPADVDAPARDVTHDYEKRVRQLKTYRALQQCYPRLRDVHGDVEAMKSVSDRSFGRDWDSLKPNETYTHEKLKIYGKVESVRTAGSKLAFIQLKSPRSNTKYQVVCNVARLESDPTSGDFKTFLKLIRKGDAWGAVGHPHRTASGELSILATEMPILLSPSLHQVPEVLKDPETRANQRHVDMLVNPEATQSLVLRHYLEHSLTAALHDRGFIKVSTPLLTAGAGGAVARPFETEATELQGEKLNLRIAPELWLKRLIVGGMDRVYEIGPAFRNEGVDATHNPEFAICEFYARYVDLKWLMNYTETILRDISTNLHKKSEQQFSALQLPDANLFSGKFDRIDFIPMLEQQIGNKLPQLDTEEAQQQLLELFRSKGLAIPAKHNLPRLLDALASHYLEPMCTKPTFITNHPACLSPLSKHFKCPQTGQTVAARAELFIRGREYANMYEEENSPFEQRRKFEEQIRYRDVDGESDGKAEVDESYLEALEWGLPPTGGWGCGVDRLVMLFSGRERMADVLAFGSLRNVVALGSSGRRRSRSAS